MTSIVLIGMMGSGKSTVGRELARLLSLPFVDTDHILVNKLGRPVTQIFRIYGETAFRDHETRILQDIGDEPLVVATGGGTVLRPENWEHLRRIGRIVFLDVNRGILLDRLERTKKRRPLLEFPDWRERFNKILDERLPIYEQADLRIDVNDESPAEVAARVLECLENR
jgi:shikimate kinase